MQTDSASGATTASTHHSCAAKAPCSQHLAKVVVASWATSSPRFSQNKTSSFEHQTRACWWCRVGRARARPSLRCIVLHICCTRFGFHSPTKVYWSLGPTECSCVTSNGCCRRWANPACAKRCSEISSVMFTMAQSIRHWRAAQKATCAWSKFCNEQYATGNEHSKNRLSCRTAVDTCVCNQVIPRVW